MARTGWIKWHRKGMENSLYKQTPFDQWHAWEDLIFRANSSSQNIPFEDTQIALKRGQFLTSYLSLSIQWGWHKEKARRFIKILENNEMIVSQKVGTGKRNGVLLTIVNYGTYQPKCVGNVSPNVSQNRHSKEYNYINIIANAGDNTIEVWNKSEWIAHVSVLNMCLKKVDKLSEGDPPFCAMLLKRHGFLMTYAKLSQFADNEKIFNDPKNAKAYIIAALKKACVENSSTTIKFVRDDDEEKLNFPDLVDIIKERNG